MGIMAILETINTAMEDKDREIWFLREENERLKKELEELKK